MSGQRRRFKSRPQTTKSGRHFVRNGHAAHDKQIPSSSSSVDDLNNRTIDKQATLQHNSINRRILLLRRLHMWRRLWHNGEDAVSFSISVRGDSSESPVPLHAARRRWLPCATGEGPESWNADRGTNI